MNEQRRTYIANTWATMLDALQSPVMLLVITHILGVESAGIFSIGYTLAVQLVIIGKFNMRNFQITDVNYEYSFSTYKKSRWITMLVMVLILCFFLLIDYLFNGYSMEKLAAVALISIAKLVDAFEDVYAGQMQLNGRLDIAAGLMGIRLVVYNVVLCMGLIIMHDLVIALGVALIADVAFFLVELKKSFIGIHVEQVIEKQEKNVFGLVWKCVPLFIGAFCSVYTINSPKYAIDSYLTDMEQGIYSYISLPATFIYIFTSAIFQTQVVEMGKKWGSGIVDIFVKDVLKQIIIVGGVAALAIFAGEILGIPILSFVFGIELYEYKTPFMCLLMGGAFLGISALLSTVLTVMRQQKLVLIGYGVIAAAAMGVMPISVKKYGMNGAAITYLLLMILEMLLFIYMVSREIKKQK